MTPPRVWTLAPVDTAVPHDDFGVWPGPLDALDLTVTGAGVGTATSEVQVGGEVVAHTSTGADDVAFTAPAADYARRVRGVALVLAGGGVAHVGNLRNGI